MAEKTVFNVIGMTCEHCVEAVKGALKDLPGAHEIAVDLENGIAELKHDGSIEIDHIKEALAGLGFGTEDAATEAAADADAVGVAAATAAADVVNEAAADADAGAATADEVAADVDAAADIAADTEA